MSAYMDGRNFTPDDYRLMERIITEWLGDGFSSDEAVIAHAEAIRQWMQLGLAAFEAGHRTP